MKTAASRAFTSLIDRYKIAIFVHDASHLDPQERRSHGTHLRKVLSVCVKIRADRVSTFSDRVKLGRLRSRWRGQHGSIHNFAGSNGLTDAIDGAATRYDPLMTVGPGV